VSKKLQQSWRTQIWLHFKAAFPEMQHREYRFRVRLVAAQSTSISLAVHPAGSYPDSK
jgi:hypothetical protein